MQQLEDQIRNNIETIRQSNLFENNISTRETITKYLESLKDYSEYNIVYDLHDYENITRKTRLSRQQFDDLSDIDKKTIEYLYEIDNPIDQGKLNLSIRLPVIKTITFDCVINRDEVKFSEQLNESL